MATRTQFQVESKPACVHEQLCEAVYHQQHQRIQSLCQWMTADHEQARQLTFNVFVEAWRNPEQSWPAVSGDLLAESFANRFRWLFHNDAVAPGNDLATGLAHRPQLLSRPSTPLPVRAAVSALPSAHRLLYLLHELEGYSAETVAEWLGLEPSLCARMIHEARVQLRRCLRAAA